MVNIPKVTIVLIKCSTDSREGPKRIQKGVLYICAITNKTGFDAISYQTSSRWLPLTVTLWPQIKDPQIIDQWFHNLWLIDCLPQLTVAIQRFVFWRWLLGPRHNPGSTCAGDCPFQTNSGSPICGGRVALRCPVCHSSQSKWCRQSFDALSATPRALRLFSSQLPRERAAAAEVLASAEACAGAADPRSSRSSRGSRFLQLAADPAFDSRRNSARFS